ncbi:hypothetical protein ACIO3O_22895 [Streptomyces sp. NPDC087440]|uniref:hypothetical protein n=1 Tax=Streptomyces sp. NPDC087440 TaxID=3365790 RepID=UPI00382D37A3
MTGGRWRLLCAPVLGLLLVTGVAMPAHAVAMDDDGSCTGDLPKLPDKPSSSLPRYEYCWDFSKPGADISRLNDLGKQGWEVVAPVGAAGIKDLNFLLRRQIP